jgi:hypothetical protein
MTFKAKADEMDLAGQDSRPFRNHLPHKLKLTEDEALSLNIAAEQFRLTVLPAEEDLKKSVLAFRKANSVIAEGQPTPPLPPEAKFLLAKHNAAVLAVRDRFHGFIGDSEFERVDALIRHKPIGATSSNEGDH